MTDPPERIKAATFNGRILWVDGCAFEDPSAWPTNCASLNEVHYVRSDLVGDSQSEDTLKDLARAVVEQQDGSGTGSLWKAIEALRSYLNGTEDGR